MTTPTNDVQEFVKQFNYFDMVHRHWINYADGQVIKGLPVNPLIENFPKEFLTDENIRFVADLMFDLMREEFPEAILVCEL